MSSRWSESDAVVDDFPESDGRVLSIDPATGVSMLVLTKGLDAATTVFALTTMPRIHEANPFVAAVFRTVGAVPGALALSLVLLCALIGATEWLASNVDETGEAYSELIRLIGYGPSSVLFLLLAVHNLVLILTGTPVLQF